MWVPPLSVLLYFACTPLCHLCLITVWPLVSALTCTDQEGNHSGKWSLRWNPLIPSYSGASAAASDVLHNVAFEKPQLVSRDVIPRLNRLDVVIAADLPAIRVRHLRNYHGCLVLCSEQLVTVRLQTKRHQV